MYNFLKHPAVRIFLPALLIASILFAPAYHEVKAEPIVQVVVVGVLGGVIGIAVACVLQLLDLCKIGGGGGGGSSGGTTSGNTGAGKGTGVSGTGSGKGKSGNGSGNGSGSGGGGICFSKKNSVCGITNIGTIVGGVCNATVPPNSACPAPNIGSANFFAQPALVRKGDTTTLHWNVTNSTACALAGGGLSLSSLPIVSTSNTAAISAKTVYTLTCINGVGGPSTSAQTTVNLDPNFQEI